MAANNPKSKLGNKHICVSCGAKFYDLAKPEPICPKCGTNQNHPDASEPVPAADKTASSVAEPEIEEDELLEDGEDNEESEDESSDDDESDDDDLSDGLDDEEGEDDDFGDEDDEEGEDDEDDDYDE